MGQAMMMDLRFTHLKILIAGKKYSSLALSKVDFYGNKWFWSPEVYYNNENQTFYMYLILINKLLNYESKI